MSKLVKITFKDLRPINHFEKLLEKINQELHNLGISRNDRYNELFKIILCKIYDEIQFQKRGELYFQISDQDFYNKFKQLYVDALNYYKDHLPITIDNNLNFDETSLKHIVSILEKYSFVNTEHSIIQDFFMKFAPHLLRTDLDQYFTPTEIADFLAEIISFDKNYKYIDPAGGSGDFLVSVLKKNRLNNITLEDNIYYWDNSPDASKVANLNFIFNGDGKSNIKILDSIENYNLSNNYFDVCITNPPFGNKTIWSNSKSIEIMDKYDFGHKWIKNIKSTLLIRQQLGILFIERGLKLLKKGGILAIILPNGYLTNASESYVRKWLFDNYTIIGVISLPSGSFKKSGTGVTPSILIVKNEKNNRDYPIFVDLVKNIGFDYKSKDTPKLFKRDPITGENLLDSNGNKIPENDLLSISKKFKQFIYDNNIEGFESENCDLSYNSVLKSKILTDKNLVLCPKRYTQEYLSFLTFLKEKKAISLKDMGAKIKKISFIKNDNQEYIYLDIGEIGRGSYGKDNLLYGWQLPGRAKYLVNKYDILASKLQGSVNKFAMILEDNPKIVVTNGVYVISIKNEKHRLNFYHFMHTPDYKKQILALSTGSIMEDIKPEDFLDKILIPYDNIEENYMKMKDYIKLQEQLLDL